MVSKWNVPLNEGVKQNQTELLPPMEAWKFSPGSRVVLRLLPVSIPLPVVSATQLEK